MINEIALSGHPYIVLTFAYGIQQYEVLRSIALTTAAVIPVLLVYFEFPAFAVLAEETDLILGVLTPVGSGYPGI